MWQAEIREKENGETAEQGRCERVVRDTKLFQLPWSCFLSSSQSSYPTIDRGAVPDKTDIEFGELSSCIRRKYA